MGAAPAQTFVILLSLIIGKLGLSLFLNEIMGKNLHCINATLAPQIDKSFFETNSEFVDL